jgi:cell division protein FtsL
MALTEGLLTGSIYVAIIGYVIALVFQIYMLYLNYKQSKVNNQMGELLEEVKKIRKDISQLKTKEKK